MQDDAPFRPTDNCECDLCDDCETPVVAPAHTVIKQFRQIVFWPLQLVSCEKVECALNSFAAEVEGLEGSQWRPHGDTFDPAGEGFTERHYREFISFLPHMQRFLYGDSRRSDAAPSTSDISMRVYQRYDIRQVRVTLDATTTPVTCDVVNTGLFFFYDVDAVILTCEIAATDMPLVMAQKLMQRFGRAYPAGWREDGTPIHCPALVEWLDANGEVIAESDYHNRARFMQFVDERRAACIARHWEFVLHPLVNDACDTPGALRIREIEYYRMPVMAYLTLENLSVLKEDDFIALSFATAPGSDQKGTLPYSPRFLRKFEEKHKYERHYAGGLDAPGIDTRFFTCGDAFTIVSAGMSDCLRDMERGLLSQFRHQYFLLFLIAHFHKSALLMLSDRMAGAIKRFDPLEPRSARAFRDATFKLQEGFLRFSQRYFFTEISGRAHIRDMFNMVRSQLSIDRLYSDVRSDITDMVHYLDSNTLRRQSGAMHRLTIVTIIGMVGTISTGFLGMNLIAESEAPFALKVLYFGVVTAAAAGATALSVIFAGPLGRLMEKISGEQRTK
jgi:hypothetical protein